MIRLNKNYAIGFDKMNIILYKINIANEKSKNPGKERRIILGYYSNLENLIKFIINNEIMINNPESLYEITTLIENFKNDILKSIKELNPDTKPYKRQII